MACKPFSLDLAADQSSLPHYQPPPCQVACPIGTDVGSYVGLIWEGDKSGALEAITATNPLSAVCGRVCDAPCEPACRRANADGPVAIRALKRWVLDALGPTFKMPPVLPSKDKKVAIIGAGPAGLTAAQDIALAGYKVDLYEAQSKAGGMTLWGIPDFRLPSAVVEEDINRILERCPGITLHLNAPLGEKVSLKELAASHDAVLLAIGASKGKSIGIPGEELDGVIDGVSFLNRINGGERPRLPAHVVVIGGGDVAMDACRTAKRLPGVEKVTVVYRRGPSEIPARKHELDASVAENIEFAYSVQPVGVEADGKGGLKLRCVKQSAGAPGADGRKVYTPVAGSEFDIPCGMVIAAVGQKTSSLELAKLGMMDGDHIATRSSDMGTKVDKVFSAGDAAFGSSTIVQAMFQGHKAAYYVLAALEGNTHPVPYRTPYSTRSVPVAQDQKWEILGLKNPKFLGTSAGAFADSEANYDDKTAKEQAARCYRCDTETGSADYSVKVREAIFDMARFDAKPADILRITRERLTARPQEARVGRPTFDDLVFLPANLTRLVIDPYREACKTKTPLGVGLDLEQPVLVAGLETAPAAIRTAAAAAVKSAGGAHVGREPLAAGVPWLQIVSAPGDSRAEAAAVLLRVTATTTLALPKAAREGQLRGLIVTPDTADRALRFAAEQNADIVILDGTGHLGDMFADLSGAPDLSLLTRSAQLLRSIKAEEKFPLIWFGGLRSGSDLAKAMALGSNAGITEVAAALAMGGVIGSNGVSFPDADAATAETALAAFLKAAVSECSMMARCTGKTNVHNLEPEDLRTISFAAQKATGVVMAGLKKSA